MNSTVAVDTEVAGDPALRYFTPAELGRLNPGRYHDARHAVRVAETVASLAQGVGRSRDEVEFLRQVALIHDADERRDLATGRPGNPITPARVQVTLDWMDRNRQALASRFGWTEALHHRARAVVARTDYPFDEVPRAYGTAYDGKSPVEVYGQILTQVPGPARPRTMQDGLLLRFADQIANYTADFRFASESVDGLVAEFANVGRRIDRRGLDTASFLDQAGGDLRYDRLLADELGITVRLYPRKQLFEALPGLLRWRLHQNKLRFLRERDR